MRRERVGESRENMGFAEKTTRVAAETHRGVFVRKNPIAFSAFMTSFSDLP
jgi:hypothetical protein